MRKKMKSQKRLFLLQKLFGRTKRQQIGSALMLFAVSLFVFIYYPLIQLFLPSELPVVTSGSKITIPKIKVEAPNIWNVDPFDKNEYRKILTTGVAHAKGTSYPAQSGTMFIFAHSSDFPWQLTRYNIIFFRLGELEKGDEIIVTRDGQDYVYRVREKKNVWPNEVEYLTKATRTQLILQTCTPPGTAFMRLLVFADPV
jgi:sortase A